MRHLLIGRQLGLKQLLLIGTYRGQDCFLNTDRLQPLSCLFAPLFPHVFSTFPRIISHYYPEQKMDVYSLISLHMGNTCVGSIFTGDEFNMYISGKGSVFRIFKESLVNSCSNWASSSCFCCHSCIWASFGCLLHHLLHFTYSCKNKVVTGSGMKQHRGKNIVASTENNNLLNVVKKYVSFMWCQHLTSVAV